MQRTYRAPHRRVNQQTRFLRDHKTGEIRFEGDRSGNCLKSIVGWVVHSGRTDQDGVLAHILHRLSMAEDGLEKSGLRVCLRCGEWLNRSERWPFRPDPDAETLPDYICADCLDFEVVTNPQAFSVSVMSGLIVERGLDRKQPGRVEHWAEHLADGDDPGRDLAQYINRRRSR